MVHMNVLDEQPLLFITPRDQINNSPSRIISHPTINEPAYRGGPLSSYINPPMEEQRALLQFYANLRTASTAIRQELASDPPSPYLSPRARPEEDTPQDLATRVYSILTDDEYPPRNSSVTNGVWESGSESGSDYDYRDRNLVHGMRLKLTKYKQLPDSIYPTKISTDSLYDPDEFETMAMFNRTTLITVPLNIISGIIDVDPTMAVVERLLQQFRCDYLRTAVGTYSEDRCKKLFLMKYRGYKFTQIRTNGRDVWGKWVVKQGFGRGRKCGCVIWRQGNDVELRETVETDPRLTPRVIRRFASLFGIGKARKGVTLRTCRSVGMGNGGVYRRNFAGYPGELGFLTRVEPWLTKLTPSTGQRNNQA
ncbi:hypothetical protein TWF506_005745 [Arthrobotrys conoides]|uniref:Uncharacterized protein n=1 Tax=Arthrobotrys conoides TaxID=74498 RepID=A0AAN8NPU9_9PEZI